jgi:plasmid stabilization system protein ParE
MTRYTVVWIGSALDELAELWTVARDRNAVTTAAHIVDVELSGDAATKGAEVCEGLRAFFAPPLRILFTVDEGNRIVEVVRVRRL